MVSIQGHLDRIFKGDFRGAFKPSKTVTIEQDPEDPSKKCLRFGKGQEDYFRVEGDKRDVEALQEIVSKVIESPSQLKKIKDLSLQDRPILIIARGAKGVGGYCNGNRIAIAHSKGTGYKAAATFAHELQHQYQFKRDGIDKYKGNLSLAEDILDDRLCESAAQTAAYQYLYEMKDRNFQSRNVYRNSCKQDGWYSQGLVDYSAAKQANKNEAECILAAMKGYASSYGVARSYEMDYHEEIFATPEFFGINRYAEYLREGRKEEAVKQINRILGGDRLDETAAFFSHTIGMTDERLPQQSLKETLRSAEYAFITPVTARFLDMAKETYEKCCGRKHEKADTVFSIRTESGMTDSRQFSKNDPQRVIQNAFDFFPKVKRELKPIYKVQTTDDRELYSLDGRNKDPDNFSAAFFYRASIEHETWKDSRLKLEELDLRKEKLYQMFSVLMKDEQLRQELLQSSSSAPLIVGFGQKPQSNNETMIALNPQKSAENLAKDFKDQWKGVKEYLNKKEKAEQNSAAPLMQKKESLNGKLLKMTDNKADKKQTPKKEKSFFKNLMNITRRQKTQSQTGVKTALMQKMKKER